MSIEADQITRFAKSGETSGWEPFRIDPDDAFAHLGTSRFAMLSPMVWSLVVSKCLVDEIGDDALPGFSFLPLCNDDLLLGLVRGEHLRLVEETTDTQPGLWSPMVVDFIAGSVPLSRFFSLWTSESLQPTGLFYATPGDDLPRPLQLIGDGDHPGREVIEIWSETNGPRPFKMF